MIAAGQTGVGKTHRALKEIENYLAAARKNGQARKALIFDTNFEKQYAEKFPRTLAPKDLMAWCKSPVVECRRVLPYNIDGSEMTSLEMRQTAEFLGGKARNVMLVFDDYDKYNIGSSKTRESSSTFMSNRHRSQDLIVSHQSLNVISTAEWRNATLIRLHKCVDSVDGIKDRVNVHELLKIAELIVWEQYMLAEDAIRRGKIEPKSALAYERLSFHLYVDIRSRKINGSYSWGCFVRNCRKYLRIDKKHMLTIAHLIDVDPKAKNADELIIQRYFRQYFNGEGA